MLSLHQQVERLMDKPPHITACNMKLLHLSGDELSVDQGQVSILR